MVPRGSGGAGPAVPACMVSSPGGMGTVFFQLHQGGEPPPRLRHPLADLEQGEGGEHPPGGNARGLHQVVGGLFPPGLQRPEQGGLVVGEAGAGSFCWGGTGGGLSRPSSRARAAPGAKGVFGCSLSG